MYGAFQSSAFQSNAYQVLRSPATASAEVSGFGYPMPYFEHKQKEYQREKIAKRRQELKRIEDELAEKERLKEKAKPAKKVRTAKFLALQQIYEDEINRLRMERVWLMRRIDDEEAILVILLSLPFH